MRFQDKVAVIAGAGSIRAGMGNGKATASEYGKLDILFNNVGIADGTRGLSVPEE